MRAPSTDLVLQDTQTLSVFEQKQAALDRLETATPEEAKRIAADAETLGALMRERGRALQELNALGEIKVKAERKVGEARLSIPRARIHADWDKAKELLEQGESINGVAKKLGVSNNAVRLARARGFTKGTGRAIDPRVASALAEFDERLGLGRRSVTANRWQSMATIPDEQFDEIISKIDKNDLEVTTSRVIYEARLHAYAGAERVEKNIERLPDGRFRISFTARGRKHVETLQTTNLITARQTLLIRRGVLSATTTKSGQARLDASYGDLRVCLDRLGKLIPSLAPDARAAAEEAIAHGHRMEDALTRCMKVA